jgi:hypothetical protein
LEGIFKGARKMHERDLDLRDALLANLRLTGG